jgi:hypothetical protein
MRLVESLKPGRRKPLPLGMGYITGCIVGYFLAGRVIREVITTAPPG